MQKQQMIEEIKKIAMESYDRGATDSINSMIGTLKQMDSGQYLSVSKVIALMEQFKADISNTNESKLH